MTKGKGTCQKCHKELSGKQVRWCSEYCSKLGLKAEYKRRNPDKVREWKRNYYAGRKKITSSERKAAKQRFEDQCFRCGSIEDLIVHHIKPMRAGGTHKARNLMVLCDGCHKKWHMIFKDKFWRYG